MTSKKQIESAEDTLTGNVTITLMNLGDAARIIYNSSGRPVNIGIGQTVKLTVNRATYARVTKHIASDTLLLLPDDTHPDARITELVGLLKDFDRRDYDDTLLVLNSLIGIDPHNPRPSKSELRTIIRGQLHTIQVALNASSQNSVQELTNALFEAVKEKNTPPVEETEDDNQAEREEAQRPKSPNELTVEEALGELGDEEGEDEVAKVDGEADEAAILKKKSKKGGKKRIRVR